MKICPSNMICFQETTFIIVVIILIFLLLFIYQSYNLSHIKFLEKQSLETNYNNYIPNRSLYITENNNSSCNDTLFNAYAGPFKNDQIKVRSGCNNISYQGYGIPVNIKTQSIDSDFRQIGLLISENVDSLILPLLARPLITHRDKWQYYALSERNLKVPVIYNNKNCTNNYGCDSLSDKDIVTVNGYSGNFKVSLYENDTLTYLPII